MDPTSLRYSKTHEWVSLADNIATVGITKFAADQLQDITFIKLPSVGAQLSADASFGEIETVKAVSDLYAPVAGEVVAVNDGLSENPEPVTADPFSAGWLVRVRLAPGGNLSHLMTLADYEKQVESEPH